MQRTAIITGANTGLGYEATKALAAKGFHIVMACRDMAKADDAAARIRKAVREASLETAHLDLIDRPSIAAFAEAFRDKHDRLDILLNNAGVMGPDYTITKNGVELQLDANHLGHFLLTKHLLPVLEATDGARIVNVSSLAGKRPTSDIHFDNLNFENGAYDAGEKFMGLTGMLAYQQSKLANILFALELADRLEAKGSDITVALAHPGASYTDLARNVPALLKFAAPLLIKFMAVSKPPEGAQSLVYAATEPDVKSRDFIGPTGKEERIGPPGHVALPDKALDPELRDRFWALSEELVGETFAV